MTERAQPSQDTRFDAAELDAVDISNDGSRLRLRLLDQDGRPASVSLPMACLNTLIRAAPRQLPVADGPVHRLDGWSLRQREHDLLLTLSLPNGATITFAVRPWQIQAIASLAGQEAAGPRLPN